MGVKPGKAKGRLAGGNFTSFYQLLDTPYAMKFEQAIMVMETYRFKKRGIHQALQKLRLHGLFDQISGLILGYCLGSDDPEEYGDNRPMKELVDEVTEGYDFPVMWVGEIGHKVENILIPLGAEATMDADMLTLKIEAAVAA
jgi:muramoyltetrapeptide carboxypeptidase